MIPEVTFSSPDLLEGIDPSLLDPERRKLTCSICSSKGLAQMGGACVQCSYGKCRTAFHPCCALQDDRIYVAATHAPSGGVTIQSFCSQHRTQGQLRQAKFSAQSRHDESGVNKNKRSQRLPRQVKAEASKKRKRERNSESTSNNVVSSMKSTMKDAQRNDCSRQNDRYGVWLQSGDRERFFKYRRSECGNAKYYRGNEKENNDKYVQEDSLVHFWENVVGPYFVPIDEKMIDQLCHFLLKADVPSIPELKLIWENLKKKRIDTNRALTETLKLGEKWEEHQQRNVESIQTQGDNAEEIRVLIRKASANLVASFGFGSSGIFLKDIYDKKILSDTGEGEFKTELCRSLREDNESICVELQSAKMRQVRNLTEVCRKILEIVGKIVYSGEIYLDSDVDSRYCRYSPAACGIRRDDYVCTTLSRNTTWEVSLEDVYRAMEQWVRIKSSLLRGLRDREENFNKSQSNEDSLPASWVLSATSRIENGDEAKRKRSRDVHTAKLDDDAICQVCFDGVCADDNAIVFCDLCNLAVHQRCYGVKSIPADNEPWYCDFCRDAKTRTTGSVWYLHWHTPCELCGRVGGALKQTTDDRWVHLLCTLLTPGTWISDLKRMSSVEIRSVEAEKLAQSHVTRSGQLDDMMYGKQHSPTVNDEVTVLPPVRHLAVGAGMPIPGWLRENLEDNILSIPVSMAEGKMSISNLQERIVNACENAKGGTASAEGQPVVEESKPTQLTETSERADLGETTRQIAITQFLYNAFLHWDPQNIPRTVFHADPSLRKFLPESYKSQEPSESLGEAFLLSSPPKWKSIVARARERAIKARNESAAVKSRAGDVVSEPVYHISNVKLRIRCFSLNLQSKKKEDRPHIEPGEIASRGIWFPCFGWMDLDYRLVNTSFLQQSASAAELEGQLAGPSFRTQLREQSSNAASTTKQNGAKANTASRLLAHEAAYRLTPDAPFRGDPIVDTLIAMRARLQAESVSVQNVSDPIPGFPNCCVCQSAFGRVILSSAGVWVHPICAWFDGWLVVSRSPHQSSICLSSDGGVSSHFCQESLNSVATQIAEKGRGNELIPGATYAGGDQSLHVEFFPPKDIHREFEWPGCDMLLQKHYTKELENVEAVKNFCAKACNEMLPTIAWHLVETLRTLWKLPSLKIEGGRRDLQMQYEIRDKYRHRPPGQPDSAAFPVRYEPLQKRIEKYQSSANAYKELTNLPETEAKHFGELFPFCFKSEIAQRSLEGKPVPIVWVLRGLQCGQRSAFLGIRQLLGLVKRLKMNCSNSGQLEANPTLTLGEKRTPNFDPAFKFAQGRQFSTSIAPTDTITPKGKSTVSASGKIQHSSKGKPANQSSASYKGKAKPKKSSQFVSSKNKATEHAALATPSTPLKEYAYCAARRLEYRVIGALIDQVRRIVGSDEEPNGDPKIAGARLGRQGIEFLYQSGRCGICWQESRVLDNFIKCRCCGLLVHPTCYGIVDEDSYNHDEDSLHRTFVQDWRGWWGKGDQGSRRHVDPSLPYSQKRSPSQVPGAKQEMDIQNDLVAEQGLFGKFSVENTLKTLSSLPGSRNTSNGQETAAYCGHGQIKVGITKEQGDLFIYHKGRENPLTGADPLFLCDRCVCLMQVTASSPVLKQHIIHVSGLVSLISKVTQVFPFTETLIPPQLVRSFQDQIGVQENDAKSWFRSDVTTLDVVGLMKFINDLFNPRMEHRRMSYEPMQDLCAGLLCIRPMDDGPAKKVGLPVLPLLLLPEFQGFSKRFNSSTFVYANELEKAMVYLLWKYDSPCVYCGKFGGAVKLTCQNGGPGPKTSTSAVAPVPPAEAVQGAIASQWAEIVPFTREASTVSAEYDLTTQSHPQSSCDSFDVRKPGIRSSILAKLDPQITFENRLWVHLYCSLSTMGTTFWDPNTVSGPSMRKIPRRQYGNVCVVCGLRVGVCGFCEKTGQPLHPMCAIQTNCDIGWYRDEETNNLLPFLCSPGHHRQGFFFDPKTKKWTNSQEFNNNDHTSTCDRAVTLFDLGELREQYKVAWLRSCKAEFLSFCRALGDTSATDIGSPRIHLPKGTFDQKQSSSTGNE